MPRVLTAWTAVRHRRCDGIFAECTRCTVARASRPLAPAEDIGLRCDTIRVSDFIQDVHSAVNNVRASVCLLVVARKWHADNACVCVCIGVLRCRILLSPLFVVVP